MAEYEKSNTVLRLRLARERVKSERGKCEGRKAHAELRPELVGEARRLARRSPKTGRRRSSRQIAAELAKLGYLSARGCALSHTTVLDLLGRAVG